MLGIGFIRKDDASQELYAGPIRFDPQAGIEIVPHRSPAGLIIVVNESALFGFELNTFGALAAVRGLIGHLVEDLMERGIGGAFDPDGFARLEAVAKDLLAQGPIESKNKQPGQSRRQGHSHRGSRDSCHAPSSSVSLAVCPQARVSIRSD